MSRHPNGASASLGALALIVGAWALPLGIPAVLADDATPPSSEATGSIPDQTTDSTPPTSEPAPPTSEPAPPTSEPAPPTSEPAPTTVPDHGGKGDPSRIVFTVGWRGLDGSTVPPDEAVTAAVRAEFALSGASATGKNQPTSAQCAYPPAGGGLECTYVNPGHGGGEGMIVPARPGATYTVSVAGIPDGWAVDPTTVGTFLGRETCPTDGDHTGDHDPGGHEPGHEPGGHEPGEGDTGDHPEVTDPSGGRTCVHAVRVDALPAPPTTTTSTTVAPTTTTAPGATTTTSVASSPAATSSPTTTAVLGSGSSLPRTGRGSGHLAALALVLVAGGGTLVRVARRAG